MNFHRGLWADLPEKRGQWSSESSFVGPEIWIDEECAGCTTQHRCHALRHVLRAPSDNCRVWSIPTGCLSFQDVGSTHDRLVIARVLPSKNGVKGFAEMFAFRVGEPIKRAVPFTSNTLHLGRNELLDDLDHSRSIFVGWRKVGIQRRPHEFSPIRFARIHPNDPPGSTSELVDEEPEFGAVMPRGDDFGFQRVFVDHG